MEERFSRTERLLGAFAMEKLKSARVAIFGIGGVGGYLAEALARSGVGHLTLIDNDAVSISNVNRQIYALSSTVGKLKTVVAKERIKDISPDCDVKTYETFFTPENADDFPFGEYDYIADAIDTVSAKLALAVKAQEAGVKIISAMGAGNKLDPTKFIVTDVYKTSECPLARVMRIGCKKRGIKALKVVYSKEKAIKLSENSEITNGNGRRSVPSSVAFVPPVAGFIMAAEIIKDLTK